MRTPRLIISLVFASAAVVAANRPQCVTNASFTPDVYFTKYAHEPRTPSSRAVLLDLGANYANTLRMYKDGMTAG